MLDVDNSAGDGRAVDRPVRLRRSDREVVEEVAVEVADREALTEVLLRSAVAARIQRLGADLLEPGGAAAVNPDHPVVCGVLIAGGEVEAWRPYREVVEAVAIEVAGGERSAEAGVLLRDRNPQDVPDH